MPHWFERQRIPKDRDRRRKLTGDDIEAIRRMHKEGRTIRSIAREFEGVCTRRAIQFRLFPERIAPTRANRKAKNHYYNRDKHREYMRKHRAYKKELLGLKSKSRKNKNEHKTI